MRIPVALLLELLRVYEKLRLLAGVGREKCRVVAVLAHRQSNEALLGQFKFAALGNQHLGRDLGLDLAHRLVVVDGQIAHSATALRADDVGTPAVVREALRQA